MTTLFGGERRADHAVPNGPAAIVLYTLTGVLWLSLAIANFRAEQHLDRAWIQSGTAALSLATAFLHLLRGRRERRAA